MNSTELFADPEVNDGMFGKPQAEQDWLRAEQEEQQWLQAEQDALSQGSNGPPNLTGPLRFTDASTSAS